MRVCVCVFWCLREAATVREDVYTVTSEASLLLACVCVLRGVYMFEFTLCACEYGCVCA